MFMLLCEMNVGDRISEHGSNKPELSCRTNRESGFRDIIFKIKHKYNMDKQTPRCL